MGQCKIQVFKKITLDLTTGSNNPVYHQLGAEITVVEMYLSNGQKAEFGYTLTPNLEKSQFDITSAGDYTGVEVRITALYETGNEIGAGRCC